MGYTLVAIPALLAGEVPGRVCQSHGSILFGQLLPEWRAAVEPGTGLERGVTEGQKGRVLSLAAWTADSLAPWMYFPLKCLAGNLPHVKFPQPAPCGSSVSSPSLATLQKYIQREHAWDRLNTDGLRKEFEFSLLMSLWLILVNVSVHSIAVGTGSKWIHPDRG